MTIAQRLASLGIELPPPAPPAGNYVGCVIDGDLVYVGGHGPLAGPEILRGKVGGDLTLEQGRTAARMTALSILATLQAELGDLDRIERFLKVFGMVNVAPGFNRTPAVLDGCSDLLVEVFGDAGRHTRSAVGMAELPFDIAVEIELVARLRPPPPGAGTAEEEPPASSAALERYYGAYADSGDAGGPGHVVAQRATDGGDVAEVLWIPTLELRGRVLVCEYEARQDGIGDTLAQELIVAKILEELSEDSYRDVADSIEFLNLGTGERRTVPYPR